MHRQIRMCRCASPLFIALALYGSISMATPIIDDFEMTANPSGAAPLTAVLAFTTDAPTRAEVRISEGERSRSVGASGEFAREHKVNLLGMRAGKTHLVSVVAVDRDGNRSIPVSREIVTAPLPDDFPPIEVTLSHPDSMEPGVTMFSVIHWPGAAPDNDYGLLLMIDHHGEVVWFYRTDHGIGDARRLLNGNIGYHHGRGGGFVEIDMLGNVIRQWFPTALPRPIPEGAIGVDTMTFHHEVFQAPSGNLITLSNEVRVFENYPQSETDPDKPWGPATLAGDVAIEFTPAGKITREWKILDIIDPYRIGYGSLGPGYWADTFAEVAEGGVKDWAHTNAIVYDPSDDSAIMSMYHLDAVFKIDWSTGQLKWILGNHGGWGERWQPYLLRPVGDLTWQYHQHGSKVTPNGTILLFDNGTDRARPFEKRMPVAESYSRAVEFAIDEEKMEVREVWSYGGREGERFFSRFICDADWLPKTSNILITDGGRIADLEGNESPGFFGHHWARILEVTHETPAQKVFEITIDAERPDGWAVYRAERLAGVYPSE